MKIDEADSFSFGEAQHYTLLDVPWFRILESSGGLGINIYGYPLGKSHKKKLPKWTAFLKNIVSYFILSQQFYCSFDLCRLLC